MCGLYSQEKLHEEQSRDNIGQDGNFLSLATSHLDDGVGDEAKADAGSDGIEEGHACNGEEAVKAFENSDIGSINVILMDVMMPVMNGLEATKKIRLLCRPDAGSVPIISMTANAFEEDVEKSLAAGMNEHLSKPINGKLLVSTLMKYKNQIT